MTKAGKKAVLGIIGGSGIYDLPGLTGLREEAVASPWGEPSDVLRFGRIGGTESCSCPATGVGTASRLPISTTAPISTP